MTNGLPVRWSSSENQTSRPLVHPPQDAHGDLSLQVLVETLSNGLTFWTYVQISYPSPIYQLMCGTNVLFARRSNSL